MKKILLIMLCGFLFVACHKEKNHPVACFKIDNPLMSLGDTVRIKYCTDAKISRDTKWDMGDGTIFGGGAIPIHVYKALGTYVIKLSSSEHIEGVSTHLQSRYISTTQQAVTVQ